MKPPTAADCLAAPGAPTATRRLRICLVSEEYPPETGWGGIGTYTYNLATGLAELGHRVHVIARGWGEETVESRDRVQLFRAAIPEPTWKRGRYLINTYFSETREVLLWSRRVARLVRQLAADEGLDVVESPEYRAQGLAAARERKRIPLVVKLHTPAFLCRQIGGSAPGGSRWDTRLSEHLEYRLVKRARLITSPSRALAAEVAKAWSIDPAGVRVVPNPVDELLFRPADRETPAEPVVLYVGRIQRLKGVETLIEAWPAIRAAAPGIRARLVGQDHGSGPDGRSMTGHLQGRLQRDRVPAREVEFTGPVERTALPAVYPSAAVCVVPSLFENLPYACLEAMACGCAVVASRVGGIPEIITHEVDGLLVPPNDPAALSAAVVRLLRDEGRRRELGRRARETVCARFSRAAVCAETVRLYESLVGAGRSGGAAGR